mmetsp:Transcript_148338/g.476312  ORF Transcript_148338/g.476312 Transcript_148338/m.476312 type:complete len:217 (-) Transcript_148338:152-802(-)
MHACINFALRFLLRPSCRSRYCAHEPHAARLVLAIAWRLSFVPCCRAGAHLIRRRRTRRRPPCPGRRSRNLCTPGGGAPGSLSTPTSPRERPPAERRGEEGPPPVVRPPARRQRSPPPREKNRPGARASAWQRLLPDAQTCRSAPPRSAAQSSFGTRRPGPWTAGQRPRCAKTSTTTTLRPAQAMAPRSGRGRHWRPPKAWPNGRARRARAAVRPR